MGARPGAALRFLCTFFTITLGLHYVPARMAGLRRPTNKHTHTRMPKSDTSRRPTVHKTTTLKEEDERTKDPSKTRAALRHRRRRHRQPARPAAADG